MPAVYLCIYVYTYMAYDIVAMYLNIRHNSDFAATEHMCLERIHWPSKLLMYKYLVLESFRDRESCHSNDHCVRPRIREYKMIIQVEQIYMQAANSGQTQCLFCFNHNTEHVCSGSLLVCG